MPFLPKSGCSWPLCPERAYRQGVCLKHLQERRAMQDEAQAGVSTSSLRPSGGTALWALIARTHLAAEPLCRRCMSEYDLARAATNVDHINPRSKGGGDEESNLQSLCDGHKKQKDAEDRAALAPRAANTR